MKKVLGWILVVCGIFSLPGFFSNLGRARYGYEVIGMLLGQGLIYFLAYLCLRNKTSDSELKSRNNIAETEDTSNASESLTVYSVSKEEPESTESQTKGCLNSMPLLQNNTQTIKHSHEDNVAVDSEINRNGVKSFSEETVDFPKIDLLSISWKEIETLLFEYQKAELLKKCNPSCFMNPYNHDKVELANTLLIKLGDATCLEDLKVLREMAISLDVKVSTLQIFEYLKIICNPINFVGSKDLFSIANNLYSRIIESQYNISELDNILRQAKRTIPLKSNVEEVSTIVEPQNSMSKSQIAIFTICVIWICTHVFMWAYKGMLYNATSYFFPFQTLNLKKYDYTEFLVYSVAFPAVVFVVGKLILYLRK